MSTSTKEPWDFDAFVNHYNEYAHEQAGWVFDPKNEEQNPPHLKEVYEKLDDYRRLRDFAERRFKSDQLWD